MPEQRLCLSSPRSDSGPTHYESVLRENLSQALSDELGRRPSSVSYIPASQQMWSRRATLRRSGDYALCCDKLTVIVMSRPASPAEGRERGARTSGFEAGNRCLGR